MEGKGHRLYLPSASEFFKHTICKKRKERQKGNGKERGENRKENKVLVIAKLGRAHSVFQTDKNSKSLCF